MSESNSSSNHFPLIWAILVCALVLGIFLYWPRNYVHGGWARTTVIEQNLMLIDFAKNEWAYVHHVTNPLVMTKQDIAPYLGPATNADGWVKPVAGEVYIIKALTESPEAQLTREVGTWPKGTIIRLATNSQLEMILPKKPQ
jgi:hypothetical protein